MSDQNSQGQGAPQEPSVTEPTSQVSQGQDSPQNEQVDTQKIFSTGYAKGQESAAKNTRKEIQSQLSGYGIDLNDIEGTVGSLKPAKEKGGDDKTLIESYKIQVEQLRQQNEQLQNDFKSREKNLQLDSQLRSAASKKAAFNEDTVLREFKHLYDVQLENGRMMVKRKDGEIPLVDASGNPRPLEDVFNGFANDNKHLFKSTIKGGAGFDQDRPDSPELSPSIIEGFKKNDAKVIRENKEDFKKWYANNRSGI